MPQSHNIKREKKKIITKKELLSIIEGLAYQYGEQIDTPIVPMLGSGAISAMESAFEVLGWTDPMPMPEMKCEYPKCNKWANCGTPTKNGYKHCCYKHFEVYQNEKP